MHYLLRQLVATCLTLTLLAHTAPSVGAGPARPASPKANPSREAAVLTREAAERIRSGQPEEARIPLDELRAIVAANPHLFSAAALELAVKHLPTEFSRSEKIDEYFPILAREIDPLGAIVPLLRAPKHSKSWANSVAGLARSFGFGTQREAIVSISVKAFASKFLYGARNHEQFLQGSSDSASASANNAALITRWTRTDKGKRIFVTGAHSDYAYVKALQARYEQDGYVLFFYLECLPLCQSETVGAFYATSGAAIHINSPSAAKSEYVPIEVAVIMSLEGKQPMIQLSTADGLIIYDPVDVLSADRPQSTIMGVQVYCQATVMRREPCLNVSAVGRLRR